MMIVNLKKFPPIQVTEHITKQYRGFAIMNEEGKFLSLDGKDVYVPVGGRNALKNLLGITDRFTFIPLH